MRIVGSTIACIVLASAPAAAERHGYLEDFIGWSADNTFYVMTAAGTDGMPFPILCLSRRGVASPSWPKKVPVPPADSTDGCTPSWQEMFPNEERDWQTVVNGATAWVTQTKMAVRGSGGETFSVKRASGEIVEVVVTKKGKRIARGSIELKFASVPVPDTLRSFWRKDGGSVAIVMGWTPNEMEIGYGPPSYLVILPLDGSAADAVIPKSRRQQAQALNVDGMKALTAKQLDDAQKKFVAATEADDSFMLAYYNLACTASLRKDRDVSIKALKTLAGSADAEAKKYLAKGLTDHDLDFIGQDPEGAKLLKRKPVKK